MKLFTIAKNILNETQGISLNSRAWTRIIHNGIKLSKNSPNPVINGESYPNEYKLFPLDFIHFTVNPQYGGGGVYDENKSGYDENGKYRTYFTFGSNISDSGINHELKHAYEDFMRRSKGHPGLNKTKEAINLFSGDFERFMTSLRDQQYFRPIGTFIYGLYFTSKLEKSAYSDTVFDDDSNHEGIIGTIEKTMKNCVPRKESDKIEKLWVEFKERFHIPVTDKFNKFEDFQNWASNEIQYKGSRVLKKLRKVKYYSQQSKKEGDK